MKKVTLKIDNVEATVPEGTTLLQAAREIGIVIPTLCYHEELKPFGACRLCMVEVIRCKQSRLVASCVYPVEEGLEVRTQTERVERVRRMILELLLPVAPFGPIKDLASRCGIETSRFERDEEAPNCTLCGLCARYCEEIVKKDAVGFVGRGINRKMALLPEKGDTCIFCRKCYTLCQGNLFSAMAES